MTEIWTGDDAQGEVYGWPEPNLALCIVKQDERTTAVVEVRPTFSESDIAVLLRKRNLYNKCIKAQQGEAAPVATECLALVPALAVSARVRDAAQKAGVILVSTAAAVPEA